MKTKVLFILILLGALGVNAQQEAQLNRDNQAAISFLPYNGNSVFNISHGLNNKLYFSNGSIVGGVKMLTLVNNGYFGIGTETPRGHLDVNGSIYWGQSQLTTDQGGSISLKGLGTTPYFDFSNHLGSGYDARFMLTGDDKLYLAGANLGIGTSNPTSPLHVLQSGSSGISVERSAHDKYDIKLASTKGLHITNVSDNRNEMVFDGNGNIGIGTTSPDEMLTVNGTIHSKEVIVDNSITPDFVFQKYYTGTSTLKKDYTMPTIEEVATFTKKNHHLPNVPSAKDMKENGMKLMEMTNILLQKVEELTLYTIEQEKRIKLLEKQLSKKK